MRKSEVYSWRVDPRLKSALEQAARAEGTSLARLLDRIVSQWLKQRSGGQDEEQEQRRLQAAARNCFGMIQGGDPTRSQRVREIVRTRIEEPRETQRTD